MSSSEHSIRREALSTYRPQGYGMSPGLLRARAPFRLRNALTGITVFGFCIAVWAYSINAVKQDSFEDIDAEATALVGTGRTSIEDQKRMAEAAAGTTTSTTSPASSPTHALDGPVQGAVGRPGDAPRGVLAELLRPSLLDPKQKTLVWGAPPVDNMGKLRDSSRWQPGSA